MKVKIGNVMRADPMRAAIIAKDSRTEPYKMDKLRIPMIVATDSGKVAAMSRSTK